MKNKKQKGKESIIGKIIYGFLLFMPLFAISVTCITCFWNKEVKADNEVANIEYKYISNDVNSANDLINNHLYTFTLNNRPNVQQYISTCSEILNVTNLTNYKLSCDTLNSKFIRIDITTNSIIFRDDNYSNIFAINYSAITFPYSFDLVLVNYISSSETNWSNYSKSNYNEIKSVTVSQESTEFDVKNVFYYSVDKVVESPLFNWSKNNDIYNVIQRTCNTLSITNTFIPMLMTYWLLISIIYFLYDIGLMIIIIVHRKIHELQDSI